MDDPMLPWWSVLLLGMWAAALTVWLHPATNRELRIWGGISCIVYLALIFIALGGNPFAQSNETQNSAGLRWIDLVLGSCLIISLTASTWMLGPICLRNKTSCYVILTIANATVCAVLRQFEVAAGLLVVAGIFGWPLAMEFARGGNSAVRRHLVGFSLFLHDAIDPKRRGEIWLVGCLTALLALSVLGTVSHSLRVESQRAISSHRLSALPTQELLQRNLSRDNKATRDKSSIDVALGTRADVVVLFIAIVFLKMGISLIPGTVFGSGSSADLRQSRVTETPGANP